MLHWCSVFLPRHCSDVMYCLHIYSKLYQQREMLQVGASICATEALASSTDEDEQQIYLIPNETASTSAEHHLANRVVVVLFVQSFEEIFSSLPKMAADVQVNVGFSANNLAPHPPSDAAPVDGMQGEPFICNTQKKCASGLSLIPTEMIIRRRVSSASHDRRSGLPSDSTKRTASQRSVPSDCTTRLISEVICVTYPCF